MRALTFSRFGGPEVLTVGEVPDPVTKPGHVIVRVEVAGLNFADIYRRRGNYHLVGEPPWILGYEAAAVVVWAPPGSSFREGDRVAFADSPYANAELVSVKEDQLEEVASGRLNVRIGGRFALADGAKAHAALESRDVIRKIVLSTR